MYADENTCGSRGETIWKTGEDTKVNTKSVHHML